MLKLWMSPRRPAQVVFKGMSPNSSSSDSEVELTSHRRKDPVERSLSSDTRSVRFESVSPSRSPERSISQRFKSVLERQIQDEDVNREATKLLSKLFDSGPIELPVPERPPPTKDEYIQSRIRTRGNDCPHDVEAKPCPACMPGIVIWAQNEWDVEKRVRQDKKKALIRESCLKFFVMA